MTAILILLKATLLVAASASGLALFGRRMSAASRHLLCALTIGGLLLLPFLSWALPEWTAVQLAASGTPAMAPHIRSLDSSGARAASDPLRAQPVATVPVAPDRALDPAVTVSWPVALLAIYAAGVLFFLARLIADRVSIRRHALHAVHVTDPDWQRLQGECAERLRLNRNVRLLRTFEQVMPMAIGIRNGAILVPAVADTWPCDRRRAVLLHELAHVARYDCLTQTIAAVACALYWIHPGVWWMARRLRIERELACDDVVVAAGADPRDYAGHLLELAYALQAHPAMALAVSMAGPRQLEGRMLALLDAARNRTAPALRGRLLGVAILAAGPRPDRRRHRQVRSDRITTREGCAGHREPTGWR